MLAATVLALFSIYASVVDAGLESRFRAHTPHKRATLSLRPRSSKSQQQCKLTPPKSATTKITQATSTTSAAGGGPTLGGGGNGKTISGVTSSECGDPKGTVGTTTGGGPNGLESWLDCGVNADGGWNPPPVTVGDLIYIELSDALKQSGTPFTACNSFLSYFNAASSKYGIPAILLASIALQESSCDPDVESNGTIGLMQITGDKCPGGHASQACYDPETNIDIGSAYFADTLASNNGNVVLTLGEYNGWYKGMTVSDATAAAHSSCCGCQQNLDYLQQTFNGWIQGLDAYSLNLGTYKNLNVC